MGKYTCMRENRAGAGGADFGEGQGGLDTHGGAGGDDEAGSTSKVREIKTIKITPE
jgi:hypothetical protein